MKLIYTPEGQPPRQFDFEPGRLLSVEAEALEDVGPWGSYIEFGEKLVSGNIRAMRALLWVMLRRTDPSLEFDSVAFRLDEFSLDYDEDEPVGKDEADDESTDSPSATTA